MNFLSLEHAIIDVYRQEIEERYSIENVIRFIDTKKVSKENISILRSFFLEYIYPSFSERQKRDKSLEALGQVLRSPRKIWPLTGVLWGGTRKLGRDMGAAMKMAFFAFDSYMKSIRLEKLMLSEAKKQHLSNNDCLEKGRLKQVLAALPSKKVISFQKEIHLFFSYLANVSLLEKMISIMENAQSIIDAQPIYSEKEKIGFHYGFEMLAAGYKLFCTLQKHEVNEIITGIKLIEEDWYFNQVLHKVSIQ